MIAALAKTNLCALFKVCGRGAVKAELGAQQIFSDEYFDDVSKFGSTSTPIFFRHNVLSRIRLR